MIFATQSKEQKIKTKTGSLKAASQSQNHIHEQQASTQGRRIYPA